MTARHDAQYLELVQASSDVVYRMSADWTEMRTLQGREFLADTNAPRGDWVDHYIPEVERERVSAAIADAIRTRSTFRLEHRVVRADGTIGWTRSHAIPLFDERGELYEWLGMATDITLAHEADDARHAREDDFRTVFEAANVGKSLRRRDGTVLANAAFADMLGYTVEELESLDWRVLTHPEDIPVMEQHLGAMHRGETNSVRLERRYIRKDGTDVWADVSVVLRRDPDGAPAQVIATIVDLSHRKQAERDLQRSEQHFSLAFHASPAPICIARISDGVLVDANDAFLALFEIDRATAIGHSPFALSLISPPEETRRIETTRDAGGGPLALTTSAITSRGRALDLHLTCWPITVNEEACYLATLLDFTERNRAEAARAQSEHRYRALFEHLTSAFMLCEPVLDESGVPIDLVILAANEECARLSGKRLEETVGRRLSEVVPGSEHDERDWMGTFGRVALTGQPIQFENRSPRVHRDFSFSAYQPEPGLCAVIFSDVTERREAEEQRAQLQSQLSQAQKMESIGQLAGGVAHDFNNMLGVILGHADLAMRTLDPATPLYSDLKEILAAARRSADLTRQLLTFARKQNVSPRVVELNVAVDGMLKMLRRLIGEHIKLDFLPGPLLWSVFADPSQLDQLLANLCVNARDAITDTGHILIETSNVTLHRGDLNGVVTADGDYVRLAVADTGCGMDAATQARIFEPFFTTKELGKGTGLGLATVYGIVSQSHGHISVTSEVGVGTTFRIFLPRHMAPPPLRVTSVPVAIGEHRAVTVLLVEDEAAVLNVTQLALDVMGHNVLAANTVSQALRAARSYTGRIDLLLTDVIMPEMNGRELAQQLRAIHPEMKVLFVSGYPADVLAPHGILDEGIQFLRKPYAVHELEAKLRETLNKP